MAQSMEALVKSIYADRLPRVFLVRWHDEDEGWRSMQVIAASRQEARDTVGSITTCPVEVYHSAI